MNSFADLCFTTYFIYISQLLRDSFSVSQQPPICEPPSHYSMIDTVDINCLMAVNNIYITFVSNIYDKLLCPKYMKGENHNICTNVRMSTPNENENSLFVKKINVNSSQMFIIYVNIISFLHYEWLYHQIHLIYTLIGVCPTLAKILLRTSLIWKHKCILDISHHLVTHTPHGQLTSTS